MKCTVLPVLTTLLPLVLCLAAPGLSVAAAESAATPQPVGGIVTAEGITFLRTVGGIGEYRLDSNGLRILLLPQENAPVATFMVTYHVGSRNEVTGTTGATHLLEHLMFKGTGKYDRSNGTGFDQVLERVGAQTNATTWLDRTNYFATVPTPSLPLLIEVEADRMRNLALREEDRQPEMTVVRNEFERGENTPSEALAKEVRAAAFLAHPYHHDTIGWRSDIERVSIEKLRAFYDTFYWPDNATVTVIGAFDPAATLAAIRTHYGPIPRAPHAFPEMYTEEPEQTGQRRVIVRRSGEIGVVSIAHKIPQATHPDWPAIAVLSAVLAEGRNSRCYRALTDKNLTLEVSAAAGFQRDPSLHTLDAQLAPGVKHEQVEKQLMAEVARIVKGGVTEEEVRMAVAGLTAHHEFLRDGSFAQASEINECIAVGDWTLFFSLPEVWKAVTPADVQRVARAYFIERHSTVGWFVPATAGDQDPASHPAGKGADAGPQAFEPKAVVAPKAPAQETAFVAPDLARRVIREEVAGIDVMACPTKASGIVTLRFSIPAGEGLSGNRTLAHLTAGMLERGTRKHNQFALAALLEKAGATLESTVGNDSVLFSAKLLSRDLGLVLGVLAEEVREPAFSAEEFAKEKKEFAGEVRQLLEEPGEMAAIAFTRAVFPAGHPARKSTVEELLKGIQKATIADVRAFHAAHYGPAEGSKKEAAAASAARPGLRLVAVGDLDPEVLKTEVRKAFGGWKPRSGAPAPTVQAEVARTPEVIVAMPEKASVSVILGQAGAVAASDPDALALQIATHALGSGFTSRLTGNVRDREGLTYGIGAAISENTRRPGAWAVTATFAPDLLEKGIASTRREIDAWWKEGLSEDELAYRKSAITGHYLVGLETTEGLAGALLLCAERGFDLQWVDEFPAKVAALTLAEVNEAIRKHLDPAVLTTIKAGTLGK